MLKLSGHKAQDILSPDRKRKKKRAHRKYKKNNRDDGLSAYTAPSLKAVRHWYNYSFCTCRVLVCFPPAVQTQYILRLNLLILT